MQVTDWSIWYTYSTFVTSGRISLPRVIRRALREGLCEAAFTSDARIHWSENGHHSQAHLELDSRGIELGELVLSVPASLPTFIAPFVIDAAALYMNEQYLFPSLKEHAPPYARFLLPPIWLTFAGRRHCFDLCIKIFENGVMMTQIGHLPRDSSPLSVDEFVFLAEGILHSRASDGLVPNGLMESVIRYDLSQSAYFWHRVMALCGFSWRRLPTRTVDGHAGYYVEIHESDLFSYDEEPRPLTLRTVASMIETVAAQLCFTRRHLIRRALWGRSRKAMFVGRYWFGRRDIYMIRYDEQPETKDSAFIATRADLINSVIGGAPLERLEETVKDLRPHKDYYLFVTEGVTLWICCLKALEQSRVEFADALSVDSVTHDKRAQSEFLDYMKIAHERVEWSIFDHFMVSQRVALQWHMELLSLEAGLALSSRFGELHRMVSTAAGVFGLKDTRDRVRRALEVRLAFYLQRQHSQGARFGWWLSVLIGVLGVPVLGREVVLPLMQIMRILPEHAGPEHQLVSIAVAAVVWLALAGIAWRALAPQVDSE